MSIGEAGQVLTKNFVKGKEPRAAAKTAEKITEREASPAKKAGPPARLAHAPANRADEAGERADHDSSAQAPAAILPHNETPSCNEPLTFTLKNIEPDHPSVKALGIQEDILTAFGVGYYRGRGMMGNRIVIPVFNTSRQLIAYAGFHPEERTYTYPPKFRRELELYNLSGAVADLGADQGLILVRHPLEVITLVSAGYSNAAAIIGDTLSSEQKEMLLAEYGAGERVTLLWPSHADIVPTLSALIPDFFVRLRRYEEKSGTPLGFITERFVKLTPTNGKLKPLQTNLCRGFLKDKTYSALTGLDNWLPEPRALDLLPKHEKKCLDKSASRFGVLALPGSSLFPGGRGCRLA